MFVGTLVLYIRSPTTLTKLLQYYRGRYMLKLHPYVVYMSIIVVVKAVAAAAPAPI